MQIVHSNCEISNKFGFIEMKYPDGLRASPTTVFPFNADEKCD